jgi:glycosyltransferase involved in cell wall biosynthesis
MFQSSHDEWIKNSVENVLVGQGPTMAFAPELTNVGYVTHRVAPIRTPRGSAEFAGYLRDVKPDIIHIHTEQAFMISPLLTKIAAPKAKIVRSVHAVFDATGAWGHKRRLTALISGPVVDANTAVSEYVQTVERSFGRECELITNWADPKYEESALDQIRFQDAMALVGNCADVKNHEVVLHAALSSGTPIHHLGSEDAASNEELLLLAKLDSLGLLLTRGVQDPLPVLLQGPVFCLPSKTEGFSISLLEALTLGNHALVSSARSLDWSSQFPTVLRADWRSSDCWSDQVRQVIELRQSRGREQSIAARALAVSKFSAQSGVRAYSDLYKRILNGT